MADVAEAVAAALSAAMAAPAMSPEIKHEPESSLDDPMILESDPPKSPQSPLKRHRPSEDSHNEDVQEGKRMKMETDVHDGLDDIARLIREAEESAMQGFQPHAEQEEVPAPDIFQSTEPASMEQAAMEADIAAALAQQQTSPIEDSQPPRESLWTNPRDYTRRKYILPTLSKMAVDILVALSEQTLEDTIATLGNDPDSPITKEYAVLRSCFGFQRSQLFPLPPTGAGARILLDPKELGVSGPSREIIRIANLASTCASIFGTNEITLEDVHNHFLEIFVPENHALPQDTAELFLGLKTQLCLGILENDHGKFKDRFLEDILVTGVECALKTRHPESPLTETESNFVAAVEARRAMLLGESSTVESIHALNKQFNYEMFLDSLSTFINDHIDEIRNQASGEIEVSWEAEMNMPDEVADHDIGGDFDLDAAIAEASRAAQRASEPAGDATDAGADLSAFLLENISKAAEQARGTKISADTELPSDLASAAESASRATMLALQSIQQNQYHPTTLSLSQPAGKPTSMNGGENPTEYRPIPNAQPVSGHNNYQPQQTQSQEPYYQYQQQPAANMHSPYQDPNPNNHLPPHQTDSTPALYERARQAAAARSSTHARREGSHSTRRPWSPEEEKALMMGLDMVKGPHWSQILSLFGPNGSMGNILADRTQVQLKDKARNLKLFFLKTNSEMPYYLQCVTGELKTRAPTQAARKEAEEKARMNSEEHQAHINGILALAGGLQNNSGQRPSPSGAAVPSITPNQALSHPSPQPGTPTTSQHLTQPVATAPAPPPVIPAPQPVSLPSLTPTAQNHPSPALSPQVSQAVQSTAQSHSPPQVKQEPEDSHVAAPMPGGGGDGPIDSGLSIEDTALLGLKAAMDGESTAEAVAAAPETPAGNLPTI
ncbi:hypothetical protein GGR56DRAFT_613738 [Xylariaceae sp. FL0804]|nr:hypothetical protein GGR56DRAFT_613738 [Xylariaceae sp. FL0804]